MAFQTAGCACEALAARVLACEEKLEGLEKSLKQMIRHSRREKARSKQPERDDPALFSGQHADESARFTMPAIQRDPPAGTGRARRVV